VAQEGGGASQAAAKGQVIQFASGADPCESAMQTSSRPIGRLLVNNTADQED
jgi:hypothetical protein